MLRGELLVVQAQPTPVTMEIAAIKDKVCCVQRDFKVIGIMWLILYLAVVLFEDIVGCVDSLCSVWGVSIQPCSFVVPLQVGSLEQRVHQEEAITVRAYVVCVCCEAIMVRAVWCVWCEDITIRACVVCVCVVRPSR